jgi:DNA-directed RNA polymerase subunit N (RpoN/RPB10)
LGVLWGAYAPSAVWSDRDGLLAQALTVFEAERCTGCGHPLSESMDVANARAYVSPFPMRCHACTAIAERAEKYADTNAPSALRFHAELHH